MRLFIAINLNNATKNSLIDLRDELKASSERGSFTLRENLHITLAFLGECDFKQTARLKSVMDTVSFAPFALHVERVGRFGGGGGNSESTWWAGVNVAGALSDLFYNLSDKLDEAGFIVDKRKFSPHITLGRRVVTDMAPRRVEPFGETVKKIDLMKSERIDGKLTYTSIHQRTS